MSTLSAPRRGSRDGSAQERPRQGQRPPPGFILVLPAAGVIGSRSFKIFVSNFSAADETALCLAGVGAIETLENQDRPSAAPRSSAGRRAVAAEAWGVKITLCLPTAVAEAYVVASVDVGVAQDHHLLAYDCR